MRALFNFRALVTILLWGVYLGGLIWALAHDKIDVQSFITGVGPAAGMALGYWFRDSAAPSPPPGG